MTDLARFLQYLTHEKRFSLNTITAYDNDLSQFSNYLDKTYEIKNLSEATHLTVRSWVVSLMEEKNLPRTVNRKLTTLRTFYKFLMRMKKIEGNPAQRIVGPKANKRLAEFIDTGKMNTVLDDSQFEEGFDGMRKKIVIELLYGTGMRVSELAHLKVSDVDEYNLQIKILGKRNKVRIVPIGRPLMLMLKKYFEERKQFSPGHDFILLNDDGKEVSRKWIYDLINKLLRNSGVVTLKKKSPHVMRHTFATHMLNNGADINSVKELLGHANLAATQVYTHNTIEKLKKIYEQAHPRA